MHPDFALSLHEFQEVLSVHKVYLARCCGLGSGFISCARNGSAEAKGLSSHSGFENQNLTFSRSRREVHFAGTEDEHAARTLPLDKKNGSGGQYALVADLIQRLHGGIRKPAEKRRLGVCTFGTAVDDLEPVRRLHICLHIGGPLVLDCAARTGSE